MHYYSKTETLSIVFLNLYSTRHHDMSRFSFQQATNKNIRKTETESVMGNVKQKLKVKWETVQKWNLKLLTFCSSYFAAFASFIVGLVGWYLIQSGRNSKSQINQSINLSIYAR